MLPTVAAGVRGNDGIRTNGFRDFLQQGSLISNLLRHGFNDPVTIRKQFMSSSKFPMAMRDANAASVNAAGFDFLAASYPAATILLRSALEASDAVAWRDNVKQYARIASICDMGGDTAPHGARARTATLRME